MKILHINQSWDGYGGTEKYLCSCVRQLELRGHKNWVLTPEVFITGNTLKENINSLEIFDILQYIKPERMIIHNAPTMSADIFSQMDIPRIRFLHDVSPFCLRDHKYTFFRNQTCNRTLGLACYACGLIGRNRNGVFPFTINSMKQKVRHMKQLRSEEHLLVTSQYMQLQLIQHGITSDRIHVIPLGVPMQKKTVDINESRPVRILFVGSLLKGKGLHLLLQALARVERKILLDIAGEGPEITKLKKIAKKEHIDQQVRFHGYVKDKALDQLYQECNFVVVPSIAPESFCLVGIESFSHGRPVIASQIGGISEWLKPGSNGEFFPSGDVKSLAHLISKWTSKPDLIKTYGQAALNTQRKEFTDQLHFDRLENLLNSMTIQGEIHENFIKVKTPVSGRR